MKFAQNLLINVEKVSKEARYDNELNASRLNLEIDFDEIIGELVLKEYVKDNDYFLESAMIFSCAWKGTSS